MWRKAFRGLAIALAAAVALTSSPVWAQSDPADTVPNTWYQCVQAQGPDFSNIYPGFIGFFGCEDGHVYTLVGNAQNHTMEVWAETLQAFRNGSPHGSMTTWKNLPVNVSRLSDNTINMVSFSWSWGDLQCDMYISDSNGDSLNCHG